MVTYLDSLIVDTNVLNDTVIENDTETSDTLSVQDHIPSSSQLQLLIGKEKDVIVKDLVSATPSGPGLWKTCISGGLPFVRSGKIDVATHCTNGSFGLTRY